MQLGSVYLYPNRIEVYTNLDTWVHERYRRVYNRNLKVYRGIDNRIELRVKSSDQKPVSVVGKTLVFRLVAVESQELLIKKDCEIIDLATGKLFITLSNRELQDLEPGMYQYALSYEVRTTKDNFYIVTDSRPLYVDSQYGVNATIEVLPGIDGEPLTSGVTQEFKNYTIYDRPHESYLISGVIPTFSELVTPDYLHTFQLFFTTFTGRVILQASIDNGGDPQTWVDIESFDYIDVTKEYINVTGRYKWFRFKITPNDSDLFGDFSISQTLFRNYEVVVNKPGRKYQAGHKIIIKGDRLGGETPDNDLTLTVTAVDIEGGILAFDQVGNALNGVETFEIINSNNKNTGSIDKILYR